MDHRKTINCSAKFIKFNEIENKIFFDELSKSDARWTGNKIFFIWPDQLFILFICQ